MSAFVCQAVIHTSDMRCSRCKFLWEIGSQNPPRCLTDAELREDPLKPIINEMAARSYGATNA